MKAKRVRLFIEDTSGGKYTISAEGNFEQEKILELVANIQTAGNTSQPQPDITILQGNTTQAKIARLIEERFNLGAFSSTDLKEAFETKHQQPITLSAAATYLSRLTTKGLLQRQRNGPTWLYRTTKSNILIRQST